MVRQKAGSMKSGCAVLAATAMLVLAGCTGKNFVRVRPDAFTLGKTMRDEVYARVGPHPNAFQKLHVRGKDVWTMTYLYKNNFSKALRPEITPTKAETFYFLNDVLVGMDFTDSFKGEGTEFDAKSIASIHKGESTKSDVIRLLGPPGGLYAPPLIPDSSYRALVYFSKQISGVKLLEDRKLVVSYDRNGVVTDVKYTAAGHP
jgi:hypothetical protein